MIRVGISLKKAQYFVSLHLEKQYKKHLIQRFSCSSSIGKYDDEAGKYLLHLMSSESSGLILTRKGNVEIVKEYLLRIEEFIYS